MDKIRVTNITNVAGLDISNNDDLPFLNTLNSAFSLLLPRSVTDFGRLVFTFFSTQGVDGHQSVSEEWCTSLINAIIDNFFLIMCFLGESATTVRFF